MTLSTNHKSQDQWVAEWGTYAGAPVATWDRYQWFFNPTKPSSMRLSKAGALWLDKKTQFVLHRIELDEHIVPRQLLQLERIFTAPYYIKDLLEIWVHSEQDAIMLQLHAGDLRTYLDNLQDNQ